MSGIGGMAFVETSGGILVPCAPPKQPEPQMATTRTKKEKPLIPDVSDRAQWKRERRIERLRRAREDVVCWPPDEQPTLHEALVLCEGLERGEFEVELEPEQ